MRRSSVSGPVISATSDKCVFGGTLFTARQPFPQIEISFLTSFERFEKRPQQYQSQNVPMRTEDCD